MKNCDPFVFGPAFAMLTVYGRSCRSDGWNSSSNSPPQILSPPVPLPASSTFRSTVYYPHIKYDTAKRALVNGHLPSEPGLPGCPFPFNNSSVVMKESL